MDKSPIKCPKCGYDLIQVTEFYKSKRVWLVGPHFKNGGPWSNHDINDFLKREHYQTLEMVCQNKFCRHTWNDPHRKEVYELFKKDTKEDAEVNG